MTVGHDTASQGGLSKVHHKALIMSQASLSGQKVENTDGELHFHCLTIYSWNL